MSMSSEDRKKLTFGGLGIPPLPPPPGATTAVEAVEAVEVAEVPIPPEPPSCLVAEPPAVVTGSVPGTERLKRPAAQAAIRALVDRAIKPRKNESVYSLECRRAYTARAIELWAAAWQDADYIIGRAAMSLGVAPGNVPTMWKRLKLTRGRLNTVLQRGNNADDEAED